MRPGVAERLGMGYETIRSLNPEVIYSYVPGWGSSGPDAARSGFAPLFSGFVGLHHESAGEGNIPTSPPGNEDNGNGLLGAAAILFALDHRAQTGKGQYLEHPQLNATMLMGLHLMRDADGSVVGSTGLDHERRGVHPLDRLYRTADGWLCISARTDAEFARLSGMPVFAELRDDSRFADDDARLVHRSELEAALTTVFATATTEAWVDALAAARVACAVPAGPEWPSQFLADPEQVRLGRVERYEHPRWGQVSDIAVMVRMGDAQTVPGRPAPEIGQHTREVLDELQATKRAKSTRSTKRERCADLDRTGRARHWRSGRHESAERRRRAGPLHRYPRRVFQQAARRRRCRDHPGRVSRRQCASEVVDVR